MNFNNLIYNLLKNASWVNYIIAIQIPVVICLVLQCYQFYKLGFKEFKLISYAWGINLFYLIIKISISGPGLPESTKLAIRTGMDLLNMCIFFIAIHNSFKKEQPKIFKKINVLQVILLALLAGCIKLFSGNINLIPYINLKYLPACVFDFSILYFLSFFFKQLEIKFKRRRVLSTVTFFYALLQFLSVYRVNPFEPNLLLLNIDNIGFAIGLVLKIAILISLSILIVYGVKILTVEEKESLLNSFSKASNKILDIKKDIFVTDYSQRETKILKTVLEKLLDLLKKGLGFYSSYDEKQEILQILFSSKSYEYKIGYQYSVNTGITGRAARLKKLQVMKNMKDDKDYFKFEDQKNVDSKVKSALAIPLVLDDKVLGVYMIECDVENCFSELDISIVESLIHQATSAIKNNRLINDIEISNGFLESLKKIDKEIVVATRDAEPVLSIILKSSLDLVKGNFGNIDLVVGKKLVCIASTNKENINESNDISDCLSGLAVLKKQFQYFPNLSEISDENKKLYKARLGKGYKCELIIPLLVNNEVIGVFNTESDQIDAFSKDHIEKIEGFAGQAAIAIYITKLIEDINEKNLKLENAIDKRNIEMTSLLSNLINHKIGNEIGAIRTTIKDEFLYGDFGKFSDEANKELKMMLDCAERAIAARDEVNEAVKELLVTGLTPIDFKELKLRIENEYLKLINQNTQYRIQIYGFDSLKPILVSSYLLMEVILELISNSIKSMPSGGTTTITGASEDNQDYIVFEDEGCGIEEADIEHIFVNGYSKWERGRKGGGIGLFEVKRIIEFWGGGISVTSKVGQGTKFTIRLPLR